MCLVSQIYYIIYKLTYINFGFKKKADQPTATVGVSIPIEFAIGLVGPKTMAINRIYNVN